MRDPILRYTILATEFNKLLDQRAMISIEEAKQRIRDGSLFDHLEEISRLEDSIGEPGYIDFSLYRDAERHAILNDFEALADGVDEDRKFGVTQNGLALLLAYCIECIQATVMGKEGSS